jgi:hypothetical protein
MAGFNSDQASKKWSSLQNSAGSSLNNIVQGRASTADFARVSSVLNGLSSLAATTFSQAISASEVQAKKFEASYAQLEQGIRSDNADNLTAYEKALNAALQTIEPNIVGTIKEFIELSSLESNEDLTKTMNTGFTGVREALPTDIPSTNDLLAANDLLEESLLETDASRWQMRESSLIEKIADVFKTTLRDLAEQINKERAAKQAHASHAGHPALPAPHRGSSNALVPFQQPHAMHDVIDMEPHTIADNAMQLVRPAEHKALTDQTGGMEPHTKSSVASTSAISLSAAAEQAITKAATDQTSLYQKLMDFLQKSDDDSSVDQQEEDENRADAFWNSYKSIVGDPSKSKKKSSDDEGWGWLKTLGSALLLMATNPQLFKTIGDLITKYATYDNLKKAVGEAWDWVGKQAHEVLDWVLEKLHPKSDTVTQKEVDDSRTGPAATLTGPKAGHADINNLTPAQKAEMAKMDAANKDKNPNATITAKPQGETGNQSWQSWVANKLGITVGADKVNLANSTTSVGGSTTNPGESSSVNVGGSTTTVGGNRSTVSAPTTVNSTTSTTSTPAQSASMTPGAAVPNTGVAAGMDATAGTGDNRPSKGGPQIGMSTFSFHTGTDDSLMMMNTPYFTG